MRQSYRTAAAFKQALEQRLRSASTSGIDFARRRQLVVFDRLRSAAGRDLGDYMLFTIRPDERHPELQNDAMRDEGLRFRAECTVAGKV